MVDGPFPFPFDLRVWSLHGPALSPFEKMTMAVTGLVCLSFRLEVLMSGRRIGGALICNVSCLHPPKHSRIAPKQRSGGDRDGGLMIAIRLQGHMVSTVTSAVQGRRLQYFCLFAVTAALRARRTPHKPDTKLSLIVIVLKN